MGNGEWASVVLHLRKLAAVQQAGHASDCDLLERFVREQDEAAFTALVERHGPMVLSVCRRVVRHTQDAEDACQATFLVLVRRAASIRKRASVASWLHGVAYRISRKLRASQARRQVFGGLTGDRVADLHGVDVAGRETQRVVDEELHRLPDKYRAPLVLCYLEGQTREAAALRLGLSLTVLRGRLDYGRERLRARLTRRGLTLSAALVAGALGENAAPAAVPVLVVVSTVRAATGPAAGAISAKVVALTEGALRTMFFTKLKMAAALILLIGLTATGAGLATHSVLATHQTATPAGVAPAGADNSPPPKPDGREGGTLGQVLQSLDTLPAELRAQTLMRIAGLQAKAGDRSAAWATLVKAARVADTIPNELTRDWSLLVVAWSQLDLGDLKAVARTVLPIKEASRRVHALVRTAQAQAKARDRTAARKTFQEATRLAETLSTEVRRGYVSSPRAIALQAIAEGQAEVGDEEGVLAAAAASVTASGKPWAAWGLWGRLAKARAEAGDLKGALQLVDRIEADHAEKVKSGDLQYDIASTKSSVLGDIAVIRAKAGDLKGALQVAERMPEDDYDRTATGVRRATVLRFIAMRQAAGNLEQAWKTAEALPAPEQAFVLQAIARAQMKAGAEGPSPEAVVAARATLREAFRLASAHRRYTSVVVSPEALLLIAEAQALLGDLDDARKTAAAVECPRFYSGEPELYDTPFQVQGHKHTALMFIARAQCRTGDIPGALQTMATIQPQNADEEHYAEVLQAYCCQEIARAKARKGDVQGALAWGKGRDTDLEKAGALQGVAEALLERKARNRLEENK